MDDLWCIGGDFREFWAQFSEPGGNQTIYVTMLQGVKSGRETVYQEVNEHRDEVDGKDRS